MRVKELNHVAIQVENVEKSVFFYQNVMKLERLPRPDFDFDGAWFALGNYQQLHIIEGRTSEVINARRGAHFALSVDSIEEFQKELDLNSIEYHPPKPRPDGVIQLFLVDPDGYYIELAEY